MFYTLEKDLNYGVSQMNAFSVLSLEAKLIYIQESVNYRLTGKAGKEQPDCSPKHLTGKPGGKPQTKSFLTELYKTKILI